MIALEKSVDQFRDQYQRVQEEMARVIVGNEEVMRGIMACLLTRGHVLLEGIPGLGKTKIVQTLADVMHLVFHRVQFTPDLMPGDIIGTNVVRETESGDKYLDFQKGPIFCHLLLADEVNRATPKSQSALLEAMQEKSVSVGNVTHKLEEPFFVMATQNPIEMEGTYPLPEAQMDRFLFKVKIVYPNVEQLHEIIDRTTQLKEPVAKRILEREQVLEMRKTVLQVPIARSIQDYAVKLTLATHPEDASAHALAKKYVRFGASPRGTQALVFGAKVSALLNGRVHVACEDIRETLLPALRHRLLLNFEGEAEHVDPDDVLNAIVEAVPEPRQ